MVPEIPLPEIPLPATSNATTISYERKRKYSAQALATFKFDPTLLIRSELNYYKDNNDYRGPRTFTNKEQGTNRVILARSVVSLPLDQRAQAAPANVVGTNTSRQILPEGATVVRRPGEVSRIPDLDADRPSDTRAAQPSLVAPWTEWDDNNPKGEALPTITLEDKANDWRTTGRHVSKQIRSVLSEALVMEAEKSWLLHGRLL